MFFFRVPLCLSRSLQWYSRWSTVWSPCLQTHVALSNSLHRWRQALVFPCPVVIAAILGVTLIFMRNLSWTVGKHSSVIAAFVHFSHSFCHCCLASCSNSQYNVLIGILLNAVSASVLRAASFASLSAISFPYVPAWAFTHENSIFHLVPSSLDNLFLISLVR